MKTAQRWDFFKKKYTPTRIPDSCLTYSDNMDTIVTCPNCYRKIKFGDGYTSRCWHTSGGMGYSVCEDCYEEECYFEKEASRTYEMELR